MDGNDGKEILKDLIISFYLKISDFKEKLNQNKRHEY